MLNFNVMKVVLNMFQVNNKDTATTSFYCFPVDIYFFKANNENTRTNLYKVNNKDNKTKSF